MFHQTNAHLHVYHLRGRVAGLSASNTNAQSVAAAYQRTACDGGTASVISG
jgi:hypothetical protein